MKYVESPTEKLQRDVCIPAIKSCETVSTRDLSVASSPQETSSEATNEPITFSHVGHTASEEDMGPSEAAHGEVANGVFEEKPPVKHYMELAKGLEEEHAMEAGMVHQGASKNESKNEMPTAGSFLVIDSP